MSMREESTPRRIVPPPEFPVVRTDPVDEEVLWSQFSQFYPDPVTPMTGSVLTEVLDPGFNQGFAAYGYPFRSHSRRINGYIYQAWLPAAVSAEELVGWEHRVEEQINAAVTRLEEPWERQLMPEIQDHLQYWERFDLTGVSLAALRTHLDETTWRRQRLMEIELLRGIPSCLALSLFDDLYRDLVGVESDCDAYRLLQGLDNKSLETDRALWDLSRKALAMPEVRDILEERPAGEVVHTLGGSPSGRRFLRELRAFLSYYGQRSDLYMELAHPAWIEDPTSAIEHLQAYIAHPERDPRAEMAVRAAERDRLVTEMRRQLQRYPQPVIAEFERLLKAAGSATIQQEDHNFWLDCRATYQVRRVLLEFGRRLAEAGAIDQTDDVFYLTLDELRETVEQLPGADRRSLVGERKAEMEHFRRVVPPPVLGTELPPGPPPADTAVGRTFARLLGVPPQQETDPYTVCGNAGSPGVVRGRAKVVRTLAEAGKLHKGDVLVTRTTVPTWTPLFATAAAVITDAGGILSHCAIVAREYRIPAVVGTGHATTMIQDGQLLEVDGNVGIVRILSSI